MNATTKNAEQAEMITRLRATLPKGTRVYTVLRSVAPSGTARRISVLIARPDDTGAPRIESIDWMIQRAGIFKRRGEKDGLYLTGGGMDMGFHLVYTLARKIHDDGYALTQEWI